MKKKYALITGAGSGLGREFAKLYAAEGYHLVLVDKNGEGLIQTNTQIKENTSIDIRLLTIDLSISSAAQEIFDYTEHENIEIFALVNNAGFGVFGKFSETNLQKEICMASLHVITPIALTKLFLKGMLERNEGEILNISSLAGFQPGPLMSVYYSTKAFLISFTEAIAQENKNSNLKISVLCPGLVDTNFKKNVCADKEAKIKSMKSSPYEVARFGIRAMRKGKVVALPSFTCKVLSFLPRILPRSTSRKIVYQIQMKNRG